MNFIPNKYQEAIKEWFLKGMGNAVVNAVAGSGKTSLLVWLASFMGNLEGLFVAFNSHIAKELGRKLYGTGMLSKTIHSIGNGMLYRAWGKTNLDDRKYYKLAKEVVKDMFLPKEKESETVRNLVQLANLVRLTLTDPNDEDGVLSLMARFDLPMNGYHKEIPGIIALGNSQAQVNRTIDFTDMIYLPVVLKLPAPQFDWVFVDECQDLNAAQLAIVMRCKRPGGRMLFVGDRKQAIYGFAGADARAFDKIIERTNAKELPLSVCYRCPVSHLRLAQQMVPYIEPAPNAVEGAIEYQKENNLASIAASGDLVLCRTTAPLIKHCIALVRQRIPATVRGRDIGRMLNGVLKAVSEAPGFTYERVVEYLELYRAEKIKYLDQKDASEAQYDSLNDRVDCLVACAEDFQAPSLDTLMSEIESLFSDKQEGIYFSTVHRAKGLENDNVFILRPDQLPLAWPNQQPWEAEQELNLKYVAFTRGKSRLVFLS